jgi:RNA polymerase sigma-70 factor (ECF subfamily)
MTAAASDAALLAAARAGERRAFAALVERHYPALLRACRRAVREPHAAADVAQEAVLIALLALDRLRRDERFGSWLIGIGLNVARREGRAAARRPAPVELVPELDASPAPDDLVGAAEDARRVRAAIGALPPGQRAAAALFYLAGLGHAEVADALGIPVGAVKTRLHKARAALRGRLHDLREEPLPMTDPIRVRVADVRRLADGDHERHVVVLESLDGARRLPIWIGEPEGTAIAVLLEEVAMPRPHSHRFAAALLHAAGGRLREVRVTRLLRTIFYAQAVLEDGTEVDARPSDAIALALVEGVPILVEPAVLDEADQSELPDQLTAVLDSEADARVIADETRARIAELPRP